MPRGPQLITIYWRDIPAQVNAKSRGRAARAEAGQVLLKPRFQKAIDRAAMKAGITTASDYVAEWRSVATSLDPSLDAEALDAEAWRVAGELEDAFPLSRLDDLVDNEGWDPAHAGSTPSHPAPGAPS